MKQLINGLKTMLIVLMLLMFNSCSKDPVTPDPAPKPIPVPPTPQFTSFTSSADSSAYSIWYGSNITFNWSTSDASSVILMSGTDTLLSNAPAVNGSYTTKSLQANTTYTFIAKGVSKNTLKTISISVYSQQMTYLSNYGSWKMTYNRFCNTDSLNFPNAWHNATMDCNTYLYYPSNKGKMTIGSCNPNPNSEWSFDWIFKNNESQINLSLNNLFNIDKLDDKTLEWSQTKPDLFNPSVNFKSVQKFSH